MKKTLGLLALTVAVSSVASASQDFLKNISLDVQSRYRYTDRKVSEDDTKSDFLGNEGFKRENRIRTRFFKTVAGTVVLNDEAGLEADFVLEQRDETIRKGNERIERTVRNRPVLTLRKDVKIGNFDTTWALGYEHYTTKDKDTKTHVSYNEFSFGPSFEVAGIGVDAKAVYLSDRGANEFGLNRNIDGRKNYEAWGVNLGLSHGKTIAEGKFGKVGYDVSLMHKFRDVNGKVYHKDGNGKANSTDVYLDYFASVKYTTPSFAGFTAYTALENEWEKHTGGTTFDNDFEVILGLNYNKSFETSVGKVTVTPYTSYSVFDRTTKFFRHDNSAEDKRRTYERNEARVGLKLALSTR